MDNVLDLLHIHLVGSQFRETTEEKEISIWNGPPPLISHPTSLWTIPILILEELDKRTRAQQVVVVAMDTNIALQGIAPKAIIVTH